MSSQDHERSVTAVTSGHTPGPWFPTSDEHYVSPAANLGTLIAILHEAEEDGEAERRANARLIAAAPDLLEALKMCVIERSEWLSEARAAIAKATGQ